MYLNSVRIGKFIEENFKPTEGWWVSSHGESVEICNVGGKQTIIIDDELEKELSLILKVIRKSQIRQSKAQWKNLAIRKIQEIADETVLTLKD